MNCLDQIGSEMSNVEMYPSSAVAQSHLPGSSAPSLQQPPPSSTACNFHSHHRTSAIFQNPSFENKHSNFRSSSEVSVNVNKVINPTSDNDKDEQYHPQPAFREPCVDSTMVTTSTGTATNSAMMVDETGVRSEALPGVKDPPVTEDDNVKGESKGAEAKQQPDGSIEPTGDNASNASVRKVR
ncbi:hypothetical protein PHBOTO_002262 [Pseudozyma hubeiensis]|nr:hypothetical protein PHBOTO_002262 [Pseudozyma hubeiensis]